MRTIPTKDVQAAVQILRDHNRWRRGAEISPTDPDTLGWAIDLVVDLLGDQAAQRGEQGGNAK